MIDRGLLNIICCPECRGNLSLKADSLICCLCKRLYDVIDGIPVLCGTGSENWDIHLAMEKWYELYKDFDWEKQRAAYDQTNIPYIYNHLLPINTGDSFLEIGGGPSYLSFNLASNNIRVVSVDFDLGILRLAKKNFDRHKRSAYFICANINRLPFRENVFDFSAGIGVLEHSKNIRQSIKELRRVTRDGGYTFQTVPCLSLLTIITQSIRYGTIPNIPLIEDVIKFFHVTLFRSRFMKYGYEESFSKKMLQEIFGDAGFRNIEVDHYDYNQTIFQRYDFLGKFFFHLMRMRVFGAMPFADIFYIRAHK